MPDAALPVNRCRQRRGPSSLKQLRTLLSFEIHLLMAHSGRRLAQSRNNVSIGDDSGGSPLGTFSALAKAKLNAHAHQTLGADSRIRPLGAD